MNAPAGHAALEIHASVLVRLDRRGSTLVAMLSPASVHRSDGRPGVDPGTVWSGAAFLRFLGGEADGTIQGLPCELMGGELRHAGGVVPNPIPVPLSLEGAVELHLRDSRGGQVVLLGQGLEISLAGPGTFVEDFPASRTTL
jgi:hypothetical protein